MDLWLVLRLAAFLGVLIGATPTAQRYRLTRPGAEQRSRRTKSSARTRAFVLIAALAAGIGTALLGFHR